MNIILAIIIFNMVIIIHELGHFLLAKKNGIKVLEFSVGMGPRVLTFVKNDIRYSLKLLPLGGSCLMLGEDEYDCYQEGSFNSKSVYSRISTILGGPMFNIIFAFILSFAFILLNGYDEPVVSKLNEESVAYNAGLREDDVITQFKGKKINFYRDLIFIEYFDLNQSSKSIPINVKRDDNILQIDVKPKKNIRYLLGFDYNANDEPAIVTDIINDSPVEQLGLQIGDVITAIDDYKVKTGNDLANYFNQNPLTSRNIDLTFSHNKQSRTLTVHPKLTEYYVTGLSYGMKIQKAYGFDIFKYSFLETSYWIKTGLKSLEYLITGKVGMDQLAGPVRIVSSISNSVEDTKGMGASAIISTLLSWSILISSNLGLMNLLPIPALDGGRLLFLIIEAIRGKPLNRKNEGYIHIVGFVLLMCLMVFVFYNDIKILL